MTHIYVERNCLVSFQVKTKIYGIQR